MRALVLAGATATLAVALAPGGGAEPSASSVVDRTFVCGVKLRAGARKVNPAAWSGFRDGARWSWLPYAEVQGPDFRLYAFIASGAPIPQLVPGSAVAPFAPRWAGIDASPCNPVATVVPFTRRGLDGDSSSRFAFSGGFECTAPSRVLVRVRAEFRTAVSFAQQRIGSSRYYTTTSATPARRATLAMTTIAGKPLVYATVADTGKATLFTAPTCIPD